jgi:glycosyltransferase involved in cell wall biosynthesis
MSNGDRSLLAAHGVAESKLAVVENGIDLVRFQAVETDASDARLLFIGSFRHFPNIRAYRWLVEEIWPRIIGQRPDAKLTVVAGPDPELYWRKYFAAAIPTAPAGVELRAFVADVRPLYETAQVVAVPVHLSAGTNIKVLEALAMGRPVVSTTVGCAGLDLENGRNVLIADDAGGFADAVLRLFADGDTRRRISDAGRRHVEQRFGWPSLAAKQGQVWEDILRRSMVRRPRSDAT